MGKKKGGKKSKGGWDSDEEEEERILAMLAADANPDEEEEEAPMPSAPKNKKKKSKQQQASFAALAMSDEDEDPSSADEQAPTPPPAAAAARGVPDDEAPRAGNAKKNKKQAADDVADTGDEPVVEIKSAKQKEREKKEKAKQLKKQKADEAKAKREAELRALEQSLGTASLDDKKEEEAAAPEAAGKNKKKKKKGKKADGGDEEEPPAAAAAAAKKGGKKGGPGGKIAALQKMVEQQKREEEERKRREEEERIRREEEERLAIEEEERLEAELEAKREADRLHREQLRRDGKLLTKKQKEAKARQEQRLQDLIASGAQVAGLADDDKPNAAPRRNEAEERKRRAAERKRREEEEAEARRRQEAEEAAEQEKAAAAASDGSDDDDDDDDDGKDWEALLDSSSEESDGADDQAESGSESESASESESESESEDDNDGMTSTERQAHERKQAAAARRQQRIEDAMAARSEDDLRSPICCILGHVDTGKCWGRDTPITMLDGSTRMVQDIREGDQVMGDDSTGRVVQPGSVIRGSGDLYRVIPAVSGAADSFVCNGDHILVLTVSQPPCVRRHPADDEKQAYFSEWFELSSERSYPELQSSGPYETLAQARSALPEWKPLVWQCTMLQYLDLARSDAALARSFAMYRPANGIEIARDAGQPFATAVAAVRGLKHASDDELHVAQLLGAWIAGDSEPADAVVSVAHALGVAADKKRFPQQIMSTSLEHRRAFLAGFVNVAGTLVVGSVGDDGAAADEHWELASKDEQHLVNVRRLARSVGLRAGEIAKRTGGGYAVAVSGETMSLLNRRITNRAKCVAEREPRAWKAHSDSAWAFAVEELGEGEYFGFTLDGNSRVIMGDYTVSHNTKVLDKIRQTNVQAGEAGGITQQIGATYFPAEAIQQKTAAINKKGKMDIRVPGLLVIDTPGHESFTNLRSRGSSLCNIAILVVDIMHGLEPQTLESLRLLRDRKTPFIVALNKIDRMYQWQPHANYPFRDTLKLQSESTKNEFSTRVTQTLTAFAEQGLNAKLYYENKNFLKYVSLVPTSAITGEGIPDLLALLVSLTQKHMSTDLMYLSELQCTVLEVKVVEGHGTTIDVILSNGVLHEGDRIVICGLDGPIVTNVRALLTPQPMRELRVKSAYVHHKSIKAAMGIKISAPDLEKAIAGSRLMVVGPDDDEEELMDEVMSDIQSMKDSVAKQPRGVWVQASTLGSLEALLEFLRVSKIPVFDINIGPVHKRDVTRASTMLEKAPEYAVMLCFDVKIEREAQEMADELGIKVFTADIIYHLFDAFVAHMAAITEQKRKDAAPEAVFPCVLKMVSGAIFNKRDPIIIGVDVIEGQLRQGTPLCVVKANPETKKREITTLGKVVSMEVNRKPVQVVRRGEANAGVAIRIESLHHDHKTYGRHFDEHDNIYSKVSRGSIDVLKENFRKDVSKEEWLLVIRLKKLMGIE
ncbi:eukaryotic translation initiation factor 5B [Coemansia sp. RSA 552]|nr:eukaryotic translation initiation factor 5B [Coemansia sp. RSA 552]